VAASIAIGQWLNNLWLGFIIVAGFCVLFGLIMWFVKDKLLRNPIMNKMISMLFDNEKD
jgi:hypothetical protein